MDILGPLQTVQGFNSHYVVTLIDCYSRFAISEPTILTPTSRDVITALRKVYEVFHFLPDVIRVDRGTQFTSDDCCRTALAFQSQIVESPVDTSWTNGRVERLHRVINERIRANYDKDWQCNDNIFKEMINQIIREYNTTPSEPIGCCWVDRGGSHVQNRSE
jgi:transposase InsO family protein